MTRRTVADCLRCWNGDDPAHRLEHRRADRRRNQWRAAKARKKALTGAYGGLHALGCDMPRRCSCRPIPVYHR